MLIILGGLPGTGKTTLARELVRELGAVHMRIDSIEEAILDSGVLNSPINDADYRVGKAVAEDNLHARLHSSLRVTPAQEAGLSDHVLEFDDLIALLPKPTRKASTVEQEMVKKALSH